MSSPVQFLQSYPNDNMFATPNFDEIRESHDNDLAYFDSLDTTGDSFMLESSNMTGSWDPPTQKERSATEGVLDPFLTGNPAFGSGEAMFTTHELTPPPSAMEETGQRAWPAKLEPPKPARKTSDKFMQNTGQITPPMSSKSPESEHAADTTNTKRTRKSTAKAAAQKSPASTSTPQPSAVSKAKAAPRKARSNKEESESEIEESPQSDGAKAKRARFLERNRQAAYTCRQRKKQWAKDLEGRHRELERDNQNLKMVMVSLKDEYHYLRQQVVQHSTCECTGAREYIQRASRVLESSPDADPEPHQAAPPPELEHALRASLAHYGGKPEASGLDFVHEGAELDGMTL